MVNNHWKLTRFQEGLLIARNLDFSSFMWLLAPILRGTAQIIQNPSVQGSRQVPNALIWFVKFYWETAVHACPCPVSDSYNAGGEGGGRQHRPQAGNTKSHHPVLYRVHWPGPAWQVERPPIVGTWPNYPSILKRGFLRVQMNSWENGICAHLGKCKGVAIRKCKETPLLKEVGDRLEKIRNFQNWPWRHKKWEQICSCRDVGPLLTVSPARRAPQPSEAYGTILEIAHVLSDRTLKP